MKVNKMLSMILPYLGLAGMFGSEPRDSFAITNPLRRKAHNKPASRNRKPKRHKYCHSHFGTFSQIKHVYGLKLSWELK